MDPNWQNVTDPIFHWAAERPDAPALIQLPETVSYAELASLVGKAAVWLDSIGICQGDRVAINLTNSIDHFILTLGLLRLGATTLEIAYSPQTPLSSALVGRFGVRTIFIEPVAAPIGGVTSVKVDAGWRGMIARYHGDRRSGDDGTGIFTITLTSGTQGQPKGTLTTHRRHFQRMAAYTELFAGSSVLSSERPANFLLAVSVGFSVFFQRMISYLFIGGPVTILPEFLHTIDLVKAIGAWDDAFCNVTSAMCRFLLSCAPQEGLLFPRLRALVATGGFLYPQEKLAMLARVTPNFYDHYGASGIGTVAALSPAQMRERPGSIGRPPSFIEVQVVDETGRLLPPGAVGQLRCRGTEGKGIAAENNPASDEHFADGWFYPGDMAHLDEAGYIFLRGRSADVINRNGLELFASEIEAVVAQHPSVAEVAIVGVPRPVPGDEMVALVVPRGQAQHDALAEHCRSRLPAERRPDKVYYAHALPKTAAGKLDRARVKAIVMDQIRQRIGV
jgi:acyl-coenzyme A synthetase/AMP-(fatty) acid ligase